LSRLRRENPLPEGAIPVAVGLGVNGVALVGFLAIASRRLEPADYSSLVVLTALLFGLGNGIMQPLEQELARAVSARRAHGIGPGPVIRRAVVLGAVFAAGVCLLVVVGQFFVKRDSINGWLIVALVLGLLAFCAGHLARGVLSSHHRFGSYAAFFAADGIARVALAAVFGAVGVAAVGVYGLVFAVAPFIGVAVAMARQHGLLVDGPEAPWNELTKALGWLLLGTASLSILLQSSTIAVDWLASPDQAEAAGVFNNGLQTARIPLFLFQAILAALLPKLSRLATTRDYDSFRVSLRRLMLAIFGLGAVATVAAALIGPYFMEIVFHSEYQLTARDLALLSAAFVVIMATICVDQALVALSAHPRMALGWLVALITFVVVTALGNDLFLRVELGLLAAAVVSLVWMSVNLAERLRHHARVHPLDLSEAVAEMPIQQ
jgi:O-antigen/teichoic acid export membrane protein